ncbi:MAG: NnrU family protein [Pseudomonadota bacterium]
MGWFEFALAFVAFFLTHSVPVRPPLRPILVGALGRRGFSIVYSLVSLAIVAWLIVAAGRAPFVLLWPWAPWQSYAALLLMLIACIWLALAAGQPNPFSFGGGRKAPFEPAAPGIVRLTRHPFLAVLALWASAHVLANGVLAHAILFGVFAVFAAIGGRLIDRRKKRELGADWALLKQQMAATPFSAAVPLTRVTAKRVAVGVVAWVALIAAHPLLFGVAPWP